MSGGMLGIGTSGLLAFQRALSVTGHNIANSSTEGYSRQRVDITARLPQFIGNGFLGNGSMVSGIERLADKFVEFQLRNAKSSNEEYAVFYGFAQRVDSLLADPDSGLSPGIQRFFNAVQDVTNDPISTASRRVMISEANSMVDRLQFLDNRLKEQRALVDGQIKTAVQEINAIAQSVAQLNSDIVSASARGTRSPNDLLDKRETLLRDLAERVGISTVEQDNGAINVFIGTGQNLVLNNKAAQLTAESLGEDTRQIDVGLVASGGGRINLGQIISGGRLGALLDMRSSVLDKSQNTLGRIAISLAQSFNAQHVQGFDLDGRPGNAFFTVPQPEVLGGRNNTVTGLPTVQVTNISQFTTDDYRLRFDGNDWVLRREPGGQLVNGAVDAGPPAPEIEGLTIDLSSLGGTPAKGDSFLIRPTRTAAQQLDTLITDPRQIAASRSGFDIRTGSVQLGETNSIQSVFGESGVTLTNQPSGIKPIAFIPAGATNVTIVMDAITEDDDIQIFTRDGRHLTGTPVLGSDADITWINNGVTSAEDIENNIFTESNGFTSGIQYDDSTLLQFTSDERQVFSSAPGAGLTLNYNGMQLTYSGDGDRFADDPLSMDGLVGPTHIFERLHIDQVTEPLFLLVSGIGLFNITAEWDNVYSEFETPITNSNKGSLIVDVIDKNQLTTDNYRLIYGGGNDWQVQRQPSGEVVGYDALGDPVTRLEFDGLSVDLSRLNNLEVGDGFDLLRRSNGVGDNSNALDLVALQDKLLLDGKNASFEGAYNTLVAEVGTVTRQYQVASRAQERLLAEAQAQRDSLSGVNLDEEAANLVRYQQAYQAAAQVVATASSMFDTLLSVVRR